MSLYDWRRMQCNKFNLEKLYYLSHIGNLESILQHGILPKNQVVSNMPKHYSFAEESVQERRDKKTIQMSNHSWMWLHDLVPLYLTPRTPTLYARRGIQSDLFFLDISIDSICSEANEFAFTDGNAGSNFTSFYHNLYKLNLIPWDVIKADYWTEFEDGKRKRCSEFLVYPSVSTKFFERIVVSDHDGYRKCADVASKASSNLDIFIEFSYFFHH